MLNLLLLHSDVNDMFTWKLMLLGVLIFPVVLLFVKIILLIQDSRWYLLWKEKGIVMRERRMERDKMDDAKTDNGKD